MNKRILLSVLLIISLLPNVIYTLVDYKPANALTETLRPNADAVVACSFVGAVPNFNCVDEAVPDDATTMCISNGASSYTQDLFDFPAHSGVGTINSITVYARMRDFTASYQPNYIVLKTNGFTYTYTKTTTTSWVTYDTGAITVNPATGVAWTWAEIDAIQAGYKLWLEYIDPTILGYGACTQLYIEVDYTAPSVPTVTTQAVTNIIYSAAHYALLNGNITSNGANTTDIRGFVYNTSSVASNPGNVAPPASGYSTNSTAYSSSIGAYTSNITGMAANTRYYVRAVAHNGIGWAYGDEVNFITIGSPTITTLSATSTSNSTSILNSQLTFDGNTTCNTTFGLSLATHAADFTAYTVFYTVPGTFTTGGFPAYTATSLNASTLYYYNIKIQNSFGTATGVEGTFTTTSGIGDPSGMVAVPSATTVSLTWTKGTGAVYTLIRYNTGSYPTTISIGTAISLTTGSSAVVSGLTAGTTYYFSAWGMAGGLYSTSYTTVLCTTLAANIITQTNNTTATPNTSWTQTPSGAGLSNIPVVPIFVDWVSTTYNQSTSMVWYFWWVMTGIALGILVFRFSEGKLFIAFLVEALWLGFGVVSGLIMLWILTAFFFLAAGLAFFGDRR